MNAMMERMNGEKIYMIQKQQEYEFKINNMQSLNQDLVIEYNSLFDKGKNIYNAFFELFYQVKFGIQLSTFLNSKMISKFVKKNIEFK